MVMEQVNALEEGDITNTKLTGRQKKLLELRLKMSEARKANQTAMVEEKKIRSQLESWNSNEDNPRGISTEKWLEQKKRKIGKLLDHNGLDMSRAYMLDTQEAAEDKYKKWGKAPAPFGAEIFNQKSLYEAHEKRIKKNIKVDLEEYNKNKRMMMDSGYGDAFAAYNGQAAKVSEDKLERMAKEIRDRDQKRKASYSRRRRFRDEKDIDSINSRNEHFNRKIERAYGKYTTEIKQSLSRGTAL